MTNNNELDTACNDFYNACLSNDIIVTVSKSGSIVYKIDGESWKLPQVVKLVGMPQPKGFVAWMMQDDDEDEEASLPWISEEDTWGLMSNVFELGKGGEFNMTSAPSWDDSLMARFNLGIREVKPLDFINSIKTLYEIYKVEKKGKFKISSTLFVEKVEGRIQTKKHLEKKDLQKVMAYEAQDVDYLRKWLEGMKAQDVDMAYDLVRHWLWLVKRNLFDLKVRFEVFLVLRSLTHGVGKSWSIKYLTEPLAKFRIEDDLSSLKEERSCALNSNSNLIINFDELTKSESNEIEVLKKWVTTTEMSYRPMGTNISQSVKKYATGIGTSNKPLASTIKDITGNRRFVEVVLETATRPDLGAEFDEGGKAWMSIWKNINENLEKGYYNPEENEKQKTFVAECLSVGDAVTEMFSEIFVWSDASRQTIRRQELYNIYRAYCRVTGRSPLQVENFRVSLQYNISSSRIDIKETKRSGTSWYKVPSLYSHWIASFKEDSKPSFDTLKVIDEVIPTSDELYKEIESKHFTKDIPTLTDSEIDFG